jgi:hypothetical protein
MSKGLRNIKDPLEKKETIKRRLKEKKGGLGYLAACDAKAKIDAT